MRDGLFEVDEEEEDGARGCEDAAGPKTSPCSPPSGDRALFEEPTKEPSEPLLVLTPSPPPPKRVFAGLPAEDPDVEFISLTSP